jgi:hypothetical protein
MAGRLCEKHRPTRTCGTQFESGCCCSKTKKAQSSDRCPTTGRTEVIGNYRSHEGQRHHIVMEQFARLFSMASQSSMPSSDETVIDSSAGINLRRCFSRSSGWCLLRHLDKVPTCVEACESDGDGGAGLRALVGISRVVVNSSGGDVSNLCHRTRLRVIVKI